MSLTKKTHVALLAAAALGAIGLLSGCETIETCKVDQPYLCAEPLAFSDASGFREGRGGEGGVDPGASASSSGTAGATSSSASSAGASSSSSGGGGHGGHGGHGHGGHGRW